MSTHHIILWRNEKNIDILFTKKLDNLESRARFLHRHVNIMRPAQNGHMLKVSLGIGSV